ncbi:MAG: hypothetical protein Q8L81_01615 [Bacteroidota bacterium]|nr:hypothetical protein [Bacteroidota bacterium]
MITKKLFPEIPGGGKFHSAVLTTYSLNFYYLEEQIVRLLHSKEIYNISVLADSQMLNDQLGKLTHKTTPKNRSYTLNGIKSTGAFHPKVNLFVGDNSALILIGSGNLTTSGHGKNHEVWNSIYINSKDDPKIELLHQVWSYLSFLNKQLFGIAKNKFDLIKSHCNLLKDATLQVDWSEVKIDEDLWMQLIADNDNKSIYQQLVAVLNKDVINQATILAPFYDIDGRLVSTLQKDLGDPSFNLILQNHYGQLPIRIPKNNVKFYDWRDVFENNRKDSVVHAKVFYFEGEKFNYCLIGSANASLAAFGTSKQRGNNSECCFLFKKPKENFLQALGINLGNKTKSISDFEVGFQNEEHVILEGRNYFFIISIDKHFNGLELFLKECTKSGEFILGIHNAAGDFIEKIEIQIQKEKNSYFIPKNNLWKEDLFHFVSLYEGEAKNLEICSNKQLMQDVELISNTNPSIESRKFNALIRTIENGLYNPIEIIDYLNTIQSETFKDSSSLSKASLIYKDNKSKVDEILNISHKSYEEFVALSETNDLHRHSKAYSQHHLVKMWDSVLLSLTKSIDAQEAAQIDEEELEKVDESSGRNIDEKLQLPDSYSGKQFDRFQNQLFKFLNRYNESIYFENYMENINGVPKLSLVDLAMFLVALQLLIDLGDKGFRINEGEGEDEVVKIIPAKIQVKGDESFSSYCLEFLGRFLLLVSRSGGFSESDDHYYNEKLKFYKSLVYKKGVSSLALLKEINNERDSIFTLLDVVGLNLQKYFGDVGTTINNRDLDTLLANSSFNVLTKERLIHHVRNFETDSKEMCNNDQILNDKGYCILAEDGFAGIFNTLPRNKEYIRLAHPGYEYNEDLKDYVNPKYYNIKSQKWLESVQSYKKNLYT